MGVDVIFHVAGVWGDPETMHALHVEGTRRLLALGLPLVLTSSSVTCGFGPMSCPGREDEPSEDPRSPIRGTGKAYRATKLQAEEMVRAQGGWLVHPDFVVGPGDIRGVVMGPLVRAAQLPVIPAPRGGKCFVGVDDVGEGHVLAFERGRRGRRYLLGAENRTYRDVIVRLAWFLGHRPRVLRVPRSLGPLIGGAWEQMQLDRYRDGTRARVELGWRPGPVDAALLAAALE